MKRRIRIPIRWKITTKTVSRSLLCPFCGYKLRNSAYRTGQVVRCPNCRHNVSV